MTAAFQHITVPLDGSTTSERGVRFALELARGGGSITFCSVVDPALVCLPAGYGITPDPSPMLAALDNEAATLCRRAQAQAAAAGITADVRVLHGQCADAIESLVQHSGSGAIVVGTHGRTGLARALLGSVAEDLLRRSDVPVVAVHEDDVTRTGPIAVALDASPAAHAALETAIEIAFVRGMPLALIHAWETPVTDPGRVDVLMAGAAKRAHVRGVNMRIVLREGRAGDALLAASDELECCMIVLGTHGRPFLQRLALGSVAAYVVEHARIPVVSVRRSIES